MLPGAVMKGYQPQPTEITQAAMDTMLGGGLLGRAPSGALGMNLWHGGPHRWAPEPDFPHGRPRLDMMGTGEGAQAYGHGFYSAETPGVAKSYKDNVAPQSLRAADEDTIAYDVSQYSGDDITEHAADRAVSANFRGSDGTDYVFEDGSFYRIGNNEPEVYGQNIGTAYQPSQGSLYKLDIPDADVAKYLDWDAPLSEQGPVGEKVTSILEKLYPDTKLRSSISGEQAYNLIVEKFGSLDWPIGSDVSVRRQFYEVAGNKTAEALRKAGIPGLKYFDASSRNKSGLADDVRVKNWGDGTYEVRAYSSTGQKFGEWYGQTPDDMRKLLGDKAADEAITKATEPRQTNFLDTNVEFKGTRNYVTWDQDVLDRSKILERDGEALSD